MASIKIMFTDMWADFTPFHYGLWRYLEDNFPVEFSTSPEFLFFSVFGSNHLQYDCKKIFITHEAAYPDFRWCDFAISFAPDIATPRHLQLPNFPVLLGYGNMARFQDLHHGVSKDVLASKTRFAAYLASNGKAQAREAIVDAISEYKMVESGGRHRNNIGRTIPPAETFEFLAGSKFVVACENSIAPGYVTEKIALAILTNTIPIYWGDEYVNRIFNPDRFINARNFESLQSLCDFVRKIDESDDLYMEIVSKPSLCAEDNPEFLRKETLIEFFDCVFTGGLDFAERPQLSETESGVRKGRHRRTMRVPMSDEEFAAFQRSREACFDAGWLDAVSNPAEHDELKKMRYV